MKKILILYFGLLLFALSVNGQINQVAKGFISTNVTDTAFIQTTRTNYETANGNTGGLYFDKSRDKWRVWSGSAWVNLVSSASPTITASNGLTKSSNDIKLGGSLTADTQVTGTDKYISFDQTSLAGHNYIASFGGKINYYNEGVEILGLDATSLTHIPYFNIGSFTGKLGITDTGSGNFTGGYTFSTDASDADIFTFTKRHTFTPNASDAGINLGSFAGDPSTLINGDTWYNSSTGKFRGRQGGSSVDLVGGTPAGSDSYIQYNNGGVFGAEAALAYDDLNDLATIGNVLIGGTGVVGSISSTGTNLTLSQTGSITLQPSTVLNIPSGIANEDAATQILARNGSNAMVYVTKSTISTAPAGSNTEIQFNNSGSFGADNDLTFSSNILTVGGTSAGRITLGNIASTSAPWVSLVSDAGSGQVVLAAQTDGVDNFIIQGAQQTNPTGPNGVTIQLDAGAAYGTSGNGNGGDVIINGGNKRAAGSGSDGDIRLVLDQANGGYLIITNLPTSAAGLPSGAMWNNAGILSIAP